MIDSHCHLAGEEFTADLDAVVQRARAARLAHALVILAADDDAELERAVRVRDVWPDVRFSIGVHPHAAGTFADTPPAAAGLVENRIQLEPQARAIGEIGLDYHYDFSPRDVQQDVFARQLHLARERRLPVIIHTREATDDTFRLLREHAQGVRILFHCFTGDRAMATAALDAGAFLSFAGIVSFPKAVELQEVARMAPPDRFLVETDSPYLAPVPYRGKRNEPAYVARVVEVVAELRGEAPARVAENTTRTFRSLFAPA